MFIFERLAFFLSFHILSFCQIPDAYANITWSFYFEWEETGRKFQVMFVEKNPEPSETQNVDRVQLTAKWHDAGEKELIKVRRDNMRLTNDTRLLQTVIWLT